MMWTVEAGGGAVSVILRPRGGEHLSADLSALQEQGVDILVSTMDPDERILHGLADEGLWAALAGLEFVDLPLAEVDLPRTPEVLALLRDLGRQVAESAHVAAHCRGGLGRSPAVAAAILVATGRTAEDAMGALSRLREVQVPQLGPQRAWVQWVEDSLRAVEAG